MTPLYVSMCLLQNRVIQLLGIKGRFFFFSLKENSLCLKQPLLIIMFYKLRLQQNKYLSLFIIIIILFFFNTLRREEREDERQEGAEERGTRRWQEMWRWSITVHTSEKRKTPKPQQIENKAWDRKVPEKPTHIAHAFSFLYHFFSGSSPRNNHCTE